VGRLVCGLFRPFSSRGEEVGVVEVDEVVEVVLMIPPRATLWHRLQQSETIHSGLRSYEIMACIREPHPFTC
jgi:hypothetical protein